MKYVSTKGQAKKGSFAEAALRGLASDGGLYVPAEWPELPTLFLDDLSNRSLKEIGFEVSRLFVDELDDVLLRELIDEALNFDAPLISLNDNTHVLELFHGPTLAFKDFGARFMSRIFSALREHTSNDLVILAATSGDTGSAVAQGFLGVEGIKVCLLYPSGKVSHIQEQQLTTAGHNVTALEVEGTFDDCQRLVKKAFSDQALNQQITLSSANSINIARLIPQMFYYLYGLAQLDAKKAPIFCVPSGNFGNLTAGLMAQKMGMPAAGFIAATNRNDIVPSYLETGEYAPRDSQRTISNAMDVGDPSNFARISYLFDDDHRSIKKHIWGTSFTDDATKDAIKRVYHQQNYLLDPHTAVGYNAVEKYKAEFAGYFDESEASPFIILSTAHPAKFSDVIEPVIEEKVPIPSRIAACLDKEKESVPLDNDYEELKNWLLKQYS